MLGREMCRLQCPHKRLLEVTMEQAMHRKQQVLQSVTSVTVLRTFG